MFDGGHNNEIPKILIEKVPDVVKAELRHNKTEAKYMKYAMLTAHRLVHIMPRSISFESFWWAWTRP
jgi:hypothetical protein